MTQIFADLFVIQLLVLAAGLATNGWQVLIALDQLANTLIRGWADETISSRAWRTRHKRRWAATVAVLDFVFFILRAERNHCETAWISERERRHQPVELRG